VSFRSEVNTYAILKKSIQFDKVVSAPRINLSSGEMRAYIIDAVDSCLAPGEYGIFEPVSSCKELSYSDLELIIAPGLCFTLRGDRLGYGGGFYDRFMQKHSHAVTCSLTYSRLILEYLPVKEHDLPVDYLITESGVISI
jgi:5-formyltetrahydrofolate cyclo-ligase